MHQVWVVNRDAEQGPERIHRHQDQPSPGVGEPFENSPATIGGICPASARDFVTRPA
jgi:hypothetical protein